MIKLCEEFSIKVVNTSYGAELNRKCFINSQRNKQNAGFSTKLSEGAEIRPNPQVPAYEWLSQEVDFISAEHGAWRCLALLLVR